MAAAISSKAAATLSSISVNNMAAYHGARVASVTCILRVSRGARRRISNQWHPEKYGGSGSMAAAWPAGIAASAASRRERGRRISTIIGWRHRRGMS